MQTEKWDGFTSRGVVLDTQLDGLTTASYSLPSASAVDNAANKDRYGMAVLKTGFAVNPTVEGELRLYMLAAPDGTNFGGFDSATNQPAEECYVGSFHVYADTAVQYCQSPLFVMPPCPVKFILKNGAGQTTAATLNTVTLYTTNRTIN